jgi:hypothetical protein
MDTQSAMKLEGASDAEIKEAITMAGIVRHWSTVLNGNQINEQKFRSEVDRIFNRPAPRQMRTGSSTAPPEEMEMSPTPMEQPTTAPVPQQTPPPFER